MVRLLKDLKVAEVRKQLTDKGESAEGKKPVLLLVCFTIYFAPFNVVSQRLSDWLEDNDHDPDTFDFDAKPEEPENSVPAETPEKVPQLEEVSQKESEAKLAEPIQLDSVLGSKY